MIQENQDYRNQTQCLDQKPVSLSNIQQKIVQKKDILQISPSKRSSKKRTSDRYLPLRKSPQSQKDLFFNLMNCEQQNFNESSNQRTSAADIYKIQILQQSIQSVKRNKIQSFTNLNHLRYQQDQREQQNLFLPKKVFNFTEQSLLINKNQRPINKNPIRILDAPQMKNDFYLNLLDWSTNNIVSVCLRNCVYLWNAQNFHVKKLLQLDIHQLATSLSSAPCSQNLAVGTSEGTVELWDIEKVKALRVFQGHRGRVGVVSWANDRVFASGSRDKNILVRDIRSDKHIIRKLIIHQQQVCGLKWSPDEHQLASGGNDNKIYIWKSTEDFPICVFNKHKAAVKALAWSPHQHGLLASGSGTADGSIRLWNCTTGQQTGIIETGSQVSNLIFSKTINELASTHGYAQNEINIWRMPGLQKIQKIKGHSLRILYSAISPTGTTLITGSADQTLRFWQIFPGYQKKEYNGAKLSMQSLYLR